jgi:hypothetical protein
MRHKQSNRAGRRMILGLALALVGATTAQATGVGDFVVPSSNASSVQNCVEPTEYMRRNHMEVIRHQRDTTVYGGIRSTKHSLAGCVSCHVGYDAAKKPVPINAEGQFCDACHDYAAVNLNCFDCHATIPEGEGWNQETAAAHGHQLSVGDTPYGAAPAIAQVPDVAPAENEDQ